MKDRLVKFMNAEGVSRQKLAEIAGVQPSAVSHILSGRNKPGYDFISAILQYFPSLDARWLMLGKGTMYSKNNEHNKHVTSKLDTITSTDTLRTPNQAEPTVPEQEKQPEKIVFFFRDGSFKMYG